MLFLSEFDLGDVWLMFMLLCLMVIIFKLFLMLIMWGFELDVVEIVEL